MSDLVVLKFDDPYRAQGALSAVRALEQLGYAWIDDVAVVEKHKGGMVTLHTPHGSMARGAFWGGVFSVSCSSGGSRQPGSSEAGWAVSEEEPSLARR
jgi:uncharacterized membrane protein